LRVLIVKVSSLGDVIHTLPAVTDAMHANKDLTFDWVVEENFTEIPSWHPAVKNVIPVAIRRWRKNWFKTYFRGEIGQFKKQLQSVHYDLVIDAQGLIKSGIVSRLSKGLTIGLSNRTIKEPMATLFYNKVYSVPWSEHAVERIRVLFSSALKYKYDKQEVDYGLDYGRIGINKADPQKKQILFLHGTTWKTKHWPKSYWRELSEIATTAGYRILLPWGTDAEYAVAEYIAKNNDMVTILPRQTLTELANHIASSAGVVAVDTGLGHLAAALSVPTLSLYGPTNPGLSGTFGQNQTHLCSKLDCAPCMKKTCSYSGPEFTNEFNGESHVIFPACFSEHRPAIVWDKFKEMIGISSAI
jgi:heptosyltransferase-1